MKLRNRVTVAATVAVLVSIIGMSAAVYVSIGRELRRQVDVTLEEQGDRVTLVASSPPIPPVGQQPTRSQTDSGIFTDSYMQSLDRDGQVVMWNGAGKLPVTAFAREVASGRRPAGFEEVTVGGRRVRVYTVPIGDRGALRFGRSLTEVESSLRRLTIALVAAGLVGIALAATLGHLLASRAIAPVHQLSEAARTIKRTGDLRRRLPASGSDEVASMAQSFNEVLDDLEQSQDLQRQLVADASHELRTPLTTLRTNIEVLARGRDLPEAERSRILSDLTGQIEDLTDLVGDLVDLARDDTLEPVPELVPLDELVGEGADRARRQWPRLTFLVDCDDSAVMASPDRLDRAIANLIDNAAKWSPPDGTVHISVSRGTVSVQDQGPGIDAEDLPHVFDRFYRSRSARQMPGSGLGLAIVKQTVQQCGGTVEASSPPGMGTTLRLHLPAERASGGHRAPTPILR